MLLPPSMINVHTFRLIVQWVWKMFSLIGAAPTTTINVQTFVLIVQQVWKMSFHYSSAIAATMVCEALRMIYDLPSSVYFTTLSSYLIRTSLGLDLLRPFKTLIQSFQFLEKLAFNYDNQFASNHSNGTWNTFYHHFLVSWGDLYQIQQASLFPSFVSMYHLHC